jgi:hypothetical protein
VGFLEELKLYISAPVRFDGRGVNAEPPRDRLDAFNFLTVTWSFPSSLSPRRSLENRDRPMRPQPGCEEREARRAVGAAWARWVLGLGWGY